MESEDFMYLLHLLGKVLFFILMFKMLAMHMLRLTCFVKYFRHAHPGSPYVFGLVGVDHDLDFPEPMPVVGRTTFYFKFTICISFHVDML